MTLEEVRERLKDQQFSVVAESTGLTRQTIYNIASGRTPRPSYETITKLIWYFETH